MLTTIFSYHQVLPSFLELVFPFGWQTDPKDVYFGGFRHQAHIREQEKEIQIPELGRSGRTFRMCYNLKSAGKDLEGRNWPWFVGQSAIHHSFDIENGLSCWIVVTTGDQDLQHRINAITGGQAQPQLSLEDINCRFASSLMVHLIFCEWSAYSWRKYIDFLQEQLEGFTKRAVSEILDQPPLQTRTGNKRIEQPMNRANTDMELVDRASRPTDLRTKGLYGAKFSFRDLQKAQAIEEKFQQADLLLRIDGEVLTELLESCQTLKDSLKNPVEDRERNEEDFIRFQRRIRGIQKDIGIQQMRISTVLKKSADRKTLVRDEMPSSD